MPNKIRNLLANTKWMRLLFLPLLRAVDYEISWKHDVTLRPLRIRLYTHKGYWYYGKTRELKELDFFKKIISDGDKIFEIGGHIGYVTQIFENLAGTNGKVVVCEPTPQNNSLLKKNVLKKTIVKDYAMSNVSGFTEFYIEAHGGFTNSLIQEFTESRNAFLKNSNYNRKEEIKSITVQAKTLDDLVAEVGFSPDFIKIDVEGAEFMVLQGGSKCLNDVKALMVEVSSNKNEIIHFLANYNLVAQDYSECSKNIFFLKSQAFPK